MVLPDGLASFGWSRTHVDVDDASNPVATDLAVGWLGSSASMTRRIDRRDGYARAFVEGDIVAIVTYANNSALVDLRRPDGRNVGHVEFPGVAAGSPDHIVLDPGRSILYASVPLPGGGVDIRRVHFDGQRSTTLLTLDDRFTPDGIPTERYGLTLRPDGTVIVLACGKEDGCRLWQVGAAEESAEPPVRLAKNVPTVCWVVGASQDWLVVYDDDVCYADTGEAPLPLRAIALRDGSSRLLSNDHILAGRVLDIAGSTLVAASVRSPDWSTSDILTIDVVSRERRTIVRGLVNSVDGRSGWLGVSPLSLVESWLLIAPWGVDLAAGDDPPNARLLNLETQELIELPAGTFGWD